MKYDRHLGSSVAEVPVKFQSDRTSPTTNLAALRLCQIFQLHVVWDIEIEPYEVCPRKCSICWVNSIWVATGYIDKLTNTHERSFSHSWSCVAYSVPIHSLIAIGVKAWMSNYLPDKYVGRTLKMHVSNECSLMRHLSTHIVLFVEREWEWGWEWEWERFWAALYQHSTPA